MSASRTKLGVAVVEGVSIGRAVVWKSDPSPRPAAGPLAQERARLVRAMSVAKLGVGELVRLLPAAEAELFAPELAILDELGGVLRDAIREGMRAEDVVEDATSKGGTDLLVDARARLLDAMAHDHQSTETHLATVEEDVVLVVERLTPSIVALLPARVVGLVAGLVDVDATTASASHAAILARARDVPLAYLPPADVAELREGDCVILDVSDGAARIVTAPSKAQLDRASMRRRERASQRSEAEERVAEPLTHLGIKVFVNVSALRELVPASVEGIGLLRTELVFSDHVEAPSEAEQFGALAAIAARSPGPVVVRLFDAGGDKPLDWLPAPDATSDARGVSLLVSHPRILETQLRAIVRAAGRFDVRILVPYVRGASELEDIRARVGGRVPVGALVETQEAVDRIDPIASAADFVSIGTNDLAAAITGSRSLGTGLSLDVRLVRAIERVIARSHACSREVTVCGELAGDPHAARVLIGLGVDALSVAPVRVVPVKLSLRDVSLDDCRAIALEAMSPGLGAASPS